MLERRRGRIDLALMANCRSSSAEILRLAVTVRMAVYGCGRGCLLYDDMSVQSSERVARKPRRDFSVSFDWRQQFSAVTFLAVDNYAVVFGQRPQDVRLDLVFFLLGVVP